MQSQPALAVERRAEGFDAARDLLGASRLRPFRQQRRGESARPARSARIGLAAGLDQQPRGDERHVVFRHDDHAQPVRQRLLDRLRNLRLARGGGRRRRGLRPARRAAQQRAKSDARFTCAPPRFALRSRYVITSGFPFDQILLHDALHVRRGHRLHLRETACSPTLGVVLERSSASPSANALPLFVSRSRSALVMIRFFAFSSSAAATGFVRQRRDLRADRFLRLGRLCPLAMMAMTTKRPRSSRRSASALTSLRDLPRTPATGTAATTRPAPRIAAATMQRAPRRRSTPAGASHVIATAGSGTFGAVLRRSASPRSRAGSFTSTRGIARRGFAIGAEVLVDPARRAASDRSRRRRSASRCRDDRTSRGTR